MSIKGILSAITRQLTQHDKAIENIKRLTVHAPFSAGKASSQTIAAGVISVTKPFVVVVPESGTADNLDEINNFADGKFIIIGTADAGDTITVRDESISGGNIALSGATTVVLSDPEQTILLVYKASLGLWLQPEGAGGGTPSAHATSHQHGGSDEVATATPTANAIPKAGAGGTLAAGWIAGVAPTAHAASHQHGGGDEVAIATPANNAIVKAGGAGKIANGWLDATLESLAALGTAADRIAYTTGVDTWAETPLTSFVRTILDDTNQAAVQATLALVPGTNVQAFDAELAAIAGLVSAADRLPYFTGLGTAGLAIFTAYGRTLAALADAAAGRTALGLGTIATETETNYLLASGARPLSGNWDIGEDRAILAEAITARDSEGLSIFDDGGILAIHVEDGGLVGFGGTTNPAFPVHLITSTLNAILAAESLATGDFASLFARNDVLSFIQEVVFGSADVGTRFGASRVNTAEINASGVARMIIGVTTAAPIVFGTNDIERMRLLSTGELGVGVVAPLAMVHIVQLTTTGNALRVTRNLTATSTDSPLVDFVQDHASDDQVLLRGQQDGTGDILNLFDGATEVVTVLDGGNVGVNQAAPTAKVEILHGTPGSEVLTVRTANVRNQEYIAEVSTTDATPTTLQTIPIVASTTYIIEATVVAKRTGGAAGTADDGAAYYLRAAYTTKAGVVTKIGADMNSTEREDVAAYNCALVISGTNVIVQVTGVASTNIDWGSCVRAIRR